MQILRRFFSLFLTFLLIFGIISPLTYSFSFQDEYDYAEFSNKIKISSEKIYENSFTETVSLDSPRTTFFLRFDNFHAESESDIQVEWKI